MREQQNEEKPIIPTDENGPETKHEGSAHPGDVPPEPATDTKDGAAERTDDVEQTRARNTNPHANERTDDVERATALGLTTGVAAAAVAAVSQSLAALDQQSGASASSIAGQPHKGVGGRDV